MGPAFSIHARGLISYPYPIALRSKWPLGLYYSPYGWFYRLHRTWHGIVWAAHKYSGPSYNPRTVKQQTWRGCHADGVSIWQGMSNETKDIYEKMKYPQRMTGFNRFLHYYLRENYPPRFFLLLEDGGRILQEDGYKIKLE